MQPKGKSSRLEKEDDLLREFKVQTSESKLLRDHKGS